MAEEIGLLSAEEFAEIFSILSRSFPREEYRTEEGQRALFAQPEYRVYGYREDGVLLGILAAWELKNVRFCEHLAVAPEARNRGVGRKLLSRYLAQEERPMVLEVEYPDNDLARRRIGFYQRLGLHLNRFPYLQMPLRAGDEPLPLYIMSYPVPVGQEAFRPWKKEIYGRVYGVFEEKEI